MPTPSINNLNSLKNKIMSNKVKRLQELRGSGYEVATGQPDIRGWEVRDVNGHLMGKVNDLIFDSRAKKVRYMIVDVADSKELQLEKRTVMVPIGLAELQQQYDDVILPKVTPFHLRALPKYTKDTLGSKAERDISTVFGLSQGPLPAGHTADDDDVEESFYNNEMFNEDNMYSKRKSTDDTNLRDSREETRRLSEAEAASLRRDSEIYPADRATTNDYLPGETEEEYRLRTRRTDRPI
jgi:sporulation protein YlmC with PRC-barrel domain